MTEVMEVEAPVEIKKKGRPKKEDPTRRSNLRRTGILAREKL